MTAKRSPGPGVRQELRPAGVVALMIAIFTSTYVFSSMNIALPRLGTELGADDGQLKLIMGGFATSLAVCVIPSGRLGDRFGRRRMIIIGLIAMTVVSAAAGFAPDPWSLVALRILLGITVALYLPHLLGVIQVSSFGHARGRLVSGYAAAAGLGTAAGQVIGGALLQADIFGQSWRTLVWLLGALTLVAVAGATTLPNPRPARVATKSGMDLRGVILLTTLIACFLVPVSLGPTAGWPVWMIIALLAVPLLAVAFWRTENRVADRGQLPLVPPRVLAEPVVARGLTIAMVFFTGFSALMFEYAIVSQGAWHIDPLFSGLSLLPFAMSFAISSLLVGRVRNRMGSNLAVMTAGTIAQLIALALLAIIIGGSTGEPNWWLLQPVLIMLGWAQAWQFGPLVATVMSGVPIEVAGLTGGLFAATQQLALGFGVAIYGALFVSLQQGVGLGANQAMAWCLAASALGAGLTLALIRSLARLR